MPKSNHERMELWREEGKLPSYRINHYDGKGNLIGVMRNSVTEINPGNRDYMIRQSTFIKGRPFEISYLSESFDSFMDGDLIAWENLKKKGLKMSKRKKVAFEDCTKYGFRERKREN